MTLHSKSVRTTIHSAETIAANDDLLLQILLHLPFKSLGKFKSVSKHWLSLISTTPQFALSKPLLALLLHHRTNACNLNLLPLDGASPCCIPFRSLTFFCDGSWRSIEFCNGLFLCVKLINSDTKYYVYNPTTNRYAILPPVLLPEHDNSSVVANIAFDPSTSSHYKVVCLGISHSSPRLCQVFIYSSETRDWRISGDSFLIDEIYPRSYKKGVFWNKGIHWISRKASFRFDMEEEKIVESPMPPLNNIWVKCFQYFGESWGHLYFVTSSDSSHQHLNVYEMESDCSCWFLKHRIDIGPHLAASFPEIIRRNTTYHYHVLFVAEPNADEESLLVIQIKSQVICYNFKTRTFRKIYDLPPYESSFDHSLIIDTLKIDAYHYIESLSRVW